MSRLKPAMFAFADPVRDETKRGSVQVERARKYKSGQEVIEAPEKFADRIVKTRAMISDLQRGKHGQKLMEMLEEEGKRLNPRPGTRPSIHASRPLVTILRYPKAHPSQFASVARNDLGFRDGGEKGEGSESTVYFDRRSHNILRPDGSSEHPNPLPKDLRSVAPHVILGHELIHSLRSALGIGLVPAADKAGMSDPARAAMRLEEELETVGLKKVRKGLPQHPTENDLRKDYGDISTTDRDISTTDARLIGVQPPQRRGPSVSDRIDYGGKTKADWNAAKKKLPKSDRKQMEKNAKKKLPKSDRKETKHR